MLPFLLLALAAAPGPPADSTAWEGLAVVEPVVRQELARRWSVGEEVLMLEWGLVRGEWEPGPGLTAELKGTGRGGFWIVAVADGARSMSLRLRAGTHTSQVVAARPLSRGHVLAAADMARRRAPVWGPPPGAPAAVEPGWVARRTLKAGEELTPPAVTPPDAVRSGSPVTVEWVGGPVAVTLPGTALGTVPVGATVYVRTEGGERLLGRAVAPGRVRVPSSD